MYSLKLMLTATFILTIFAGCTSSFDPTPKRVIPKYNNTTPELTARAVDTMYHEGQYEHANSLMCEPDEENMIFKIAENTYKETIQSVYSSIVRNRMYNNENFEYFNDDRNRIEEQLFKIRQHYYFNYVKYYQAYIVERKRLPNTVKNEITGVKQVNDTTTLVTLDTDYFGLNENSTYTVVKRAEKDWCVKTFK